MIFTHGIALTIGLALFALAYLNSLFRPAASRGHDRGTL